MNTRRHARQPTSPGPARDRGRLAARSGLVRRRADGGQAALIVVVALTVALSLVGAVMVNAISNNDPIVTQASIQRYAYRALASGLNAYTSAINANPYLAACNANTNRGRPTPGQCAGISYQKWSQVPGTDIGNGVVPEYYKFDNPEPIIDPTRERSPTSRSRWSERPDSVAAGRLLLHRGQVHPGQRVPRQRVVDQLRVRRATRRSAPTTGTGTPYRTTARRSSSTPTTTSPDPSSPTTRSTWTGARTSGTTG